MVPGVIQYIFNSNTKYTRKPKRNCQWISHHKVYQLSISDSVSITIGNPRRHVWSYESGAQPSDNSQSNCPCAKGGASAPVFVQHHSYCESGATTGK